MKRPAFQFYPGDWQKNAKLRRCSPAARGVWMDVLCLLHDAEEYGVLRWPLKDIANAAGASAAHVRELVEKGVLKGADRDAPAYVYRPKHAGKLGEPVTLVIHDSGPVWYSSRFVRDEWVRQKRGESTRFDSANQPDSRSPKGGNGERQGDGPSTSSSPSGSEAKASADAGAPAAVGNPETPEDRRARRMAWLSKHGVTDAGEARAFMNTLAKDYGGAIAAEAFEVAMASDGPFGDPKALVIGCAKKLTEHTRAIHAHANTVPSGAAEKTAEYLAERAAIVGAPPPASLKSIRAAIAGAGLHTPEVAA